MYAERLRWPVWFSEDLYKWSISLDRYNMPDLEESTSTKYSSKSSCWETRSHDVLSSTLPCPVVPISTTRDRTDYLTILRRRNTFDTNTRSFELVKFDGHSPCKTLQNYLNMKLHFESWVPKLILNNLATNDLLKACGRLVFGNTQSFASQPWSWHMQGSPYSCLYPPDVSFWHCLIVRPQKKVAGGSSTTT